MKFRVGQKVTINTEENVHKEIRKRGSTESKEDINIDFFRKYENKTTTIVEIRDNNDIVLSPDESDLPKMSIPEKHFRIALKNYTSIELDESLFEL